MEIDGKRDGRGGAAHGSGPKVIAILSACDEILEESSATFADVRWKPFTDLPPSFPP